jgi:hypothetical protein
MMSSFRSWTGGCPLTLIMSKPRLTNLVEISSAGMSFVEGKFNVNA